MTTRTRETTIDFREPFSLKGVERVLPAGTYRILTDEELIEGLSFPVFRRVSTMIFIPAHSRAAVEMVTIDPLDLRTAHAKDAAQQGHRP